MSETRQLVIFFAIAFSYTWTASAVMILGHLRIEYTILASLGPTLAALITNRLAVGNYRAFRFNVHWARTVAASVLGVALVLGSEIIFPAVATVDAGKLKWSALIALDLYNYSTLLGGPLTEEPGWRGFALPRLEALLGPVRASVLLGALWATWHVPFFWYPGWNNCPIGIYFLILTGFSVMLTWAANIARFGVIAPIVMHAVNNTSGRYFQGLFTNAGPGEGGFLSDLIRLIPAPASWNKNISLSFVALIALGAWIGAAFAIVVTKGRLGYAGRSMAGSGPQPTARN